MGRSGKHGEGPSRARARGDPRVPRPQRRTLPGERHAAGRGLHPDEENVFAARIHHLEAHAHLPQLVAAEEALKRTLVEDLEDLDVEYVDLLGPLRAAPAQPYFEDLDGHPSVAGHDAIANEIDRILQEGVITVRSR